MGTSTTEIFTLSYTTLFRSPGHQCRLARGVEGMIEQAHVGVSVDGDGTLTRVTAVPVPAPTNDHQDRKSTRLNSSHLGISYAVFCLKKKSHRLAAVRHVERV